MTLCIKTGKQCSCQPDEGVFCPDYEPDSYVRCLMNAITEQREAFEAELSTIRGAHGTELDKLQTAQQVLKTSAEQAESDIEQEIVNKMAKNEDRPLKHGGKLA